MQLAHLRTLLRSKEEALARSESLVSSLQSELEDEKLLSERYRAQVKDMMAKLQA